MSDSRTGAGPVARRRIAGRAAALCMVLTLVVSGAPDATGAPAEPAPSFTFGIRAGHLGQTTLPGDHFTYDLTAGSGVRDAVVLHNYSDEPLTLRLYGADVRAAPGGALAPTQATDRMTEVGAWLRMDRDEVTIPPRDQVRTGFEVEVPVGTVPSDYLGAVVATLPARPSAGGVAVETRAARLVRLRVPGDATLGVEVGAPRPARRGSGYDFAVPVRNTGNVLFTFTGALLVDGPGGPSRLRLDPPGLYVIPGGESTVHARWADPPVAGWGDARAEVRVDLPASPTQVFIGPATRVWLVPWALLIAAALLVTAGALVGFATRRPRRVRRARRRREREAVRKARAQVRAEIAGGAPAAACRQKSSPVSGQPQPPPAMARGMP